MPRMPSQVPAVDPSEAMRLAGEGAALLDVREVDEWDRGHAAGSVLALLSRLTPDLVPADRTLVVVCRSGNRSAHVTQALVAAGYDARNLTGGLRAWVSAGLPLVRPDGSPGTVD